MFAETIVSLFLICWTFGVIIFPSHQGYEAMTLNQRVDKGRWSQPCQILRLATVLCLHRNKYCMERLTSPRRIPVRYYSTTSWQHVDGYGIQIRARPDIRQLLLQLSERESGGEQNKRTDIYRQLHAHANTRTCLSRFWAVFQCAISSAKDHKAVYET